MKKNLFLTGILTTAFLFGCSDDIPDKGGVNGVTDDVGYVKVAINLPTVSGNSVKAPGANGNDDFADGLDAEFNVKNVILAIFEGENEANATFKEAHNLTTLHGEKVSGNVTVKYQPNVVEINKPEKDVFALAIVNGEASGFKLDGKKLKIGETDFTGNLSELNKKPQSVDLANMANVDGKNFLMTNAPITNKPSATTETDDRTVTTLVKLKVYDTKAKAEADRENADKIYVERAVAKVTTSVKGTDNTLTITAPDMAYNEATVTFEGWKLNLTNKTYFPVRDVSEWSTWDGYKVGTDVNRFFGETADPYRVYWAIDPNYKKTVVQGITDLNVITELPEGQWNMMGRDEYSAENTTTAGQMYRARLTGVLLKAKFTLKGGTENDNLFMLGTSSTIYSEEQFLNFATAALKDGNALAAGKTLKINNTPAGAVVNDKEGVKGLLKVSDDSALTDAQAEAILTDCSNTIRFYKGGVMFYYTTVIKHFNNLVDDGTTYTEEKHLGLYGVVRNNWYDINIKSVSGPGEPVIPEIPDEPVNKEHSFINAEINILSWAKRTQNVDL